MSTFWDRYDRWNGAFVDVVFWGAEDSQPVYLDVDEGLLARVAKQVGIDGASGEIERTFFADIRSTLNIDVAYRSDGPVFARHRERAEQWWRRRRRPDADLTEAPPVIALLAAFSRAAEHMVRDESFSSTAYLPRLINLLDVKEADVGRMQDSFRRESEFLWGLLNQWIDDAGGAFGLPTAMSIGPRYVGIPMSQALLRESDRQQLERFFEEAHLEPGLVLGTEDMEEHLSDWLASGQAPGSIKRLWGLKDAKRTLVDSVCQLLTAWTGPSLERRSGEGASGAPSALSANQAILTARIRRPLVGDTRLSIGFAVRQSGASRQSTSEWIVESAQGAENAVVELEPLTDGLLGLTSGGIESDESLLTGTLKIRSRASGAVADRKSMPLCVFVRSEEAGLFLEVQSARRDAEHLVLVNGAARSPSGKPRFDLDPLLSEIARPGFIKHESLSGLPEGWILYQAVIIERSHSSDSKALACLRPAASTAVVIEGGLRLPGRQERWMEGSEIQVRASSESADLLELELVRLDGGGEDSVGQWRFEDPEAALSLEPSELPHGRYRVGLKAHRGKAVSQAVRSLIVATSDDPRPRAAQAEVVLYRPAIQGFPGELSGQLTEEVASHASGVVFPESDRSGASRDEVDGAIGSPWWKAPPESRSSIRLAEPAAPDSCVFTGAHYEVITSPDGSRLDRGECRMCGRVRMYRKRAPARRVSDKVSTTVPQVASAPPLARLRPRNMPSPDVVLEALTWMQTGSVSEFAGVVRQLEDSALSVHEALIELECTGQVDVARDPNSLRVTHWQIATRQLAQTSADDWAVVGAWGRSARQRLEDNVVDLGGHVVRETGTWFSPMLVRGLPESDINLLADDMGAQVAPDAGRALLKSLRPLSEVCQDLGRFTAQGIVDLEWFVPHESTWRPVQLMSQAGAFRSASGFVTSYFLRQPKDIGDGTAARVTAAVAKHAASMPRPLLGYDAGSQRLLVPLGAELPGLYGRAMSLMSGTPPARVTFEGTVPCLAYTGIALQDALVLKTLFSEGAS